MVIQENAKYLQTSNSGAPVGIPQAYPHAQLCENGAAQKVHIRAG
jgi:hypothetical protein